MDILFKSASDVKWIVYNKFHVGNYGKVHHDNVSDVIILLVKSLIQSQENTFTWVLMHKWVLDKLELKQVDSSKFCRNSSPTSQRP